MTDGAPRTRQAGAGSRQAGTGPGPRAGAGPGRPSLAARLPYAIVLAGVLAGWPGSGRARSRRSVGVR